MTDAELQRMACEIFRQVMDGNTDGANQLIEALADKEQGQDLVWWLKGKAEDLMCHLAMVCE